MTANTATPPPIARPVWVPIAELHPDRANPRKISDSELDNPTRSMREFGFLQLHVLLDQSNAHRAHRQST